MAQHEQEDELFYIVAVVTDGVENEIPFMKEGDFYVVKESITAFRQQ
jgi:hypothetical protein